MAPGSNLAATSMGDYLRDAREERGLTLDQTADLSGISKSHLSRLESGERQPSVAALLALSSALAVPVGRLFGEAEGASALAIHPPDEPRRESEGLSIVSCSGFTGSSLIDALRVTIEPDRPAPVPARHPGEEWLYVLNGKLRLEYDGELSYLERGSAAHFNAELPHRLGAEQVRTSLLLVAAKPVRNLSQIH